MSGVTPVRRRLVVPTMRWLVVLVLIAWSLFPILWNVGNSLKGRQDIFAYPPVIVFSPDFSSYRKLLGTGSRSVWPIIGNSVTVAVVTTLLVLIVGTAAAYAFSRQRFKGRNGLLGGLLATRLMPPIVAVLPLFLIANKLGIVDTRLVLILLYTALNLPIAVWLLKQFFDTIPVEIEQAALIDGAAPLTILRRIILPLAAPSLGAIAALTFIICWNEFMFALLFTAVDARTLPLLLAEGRGDIQIFFQDIAALATVLMIPVFVLAVFIQRQLVGGLTTGAMD